MKLGSNFFVLSAPIKIFYNGPSFPYNLEQSPPPPQ